MAAIDLKKLKFDPAPCNKEAEGRNWAKMNLLMSFINDIFEAVQDNTENAEEDNEFDSTIGWAISQNDGTEDTFVAPSEDNGWRGQVKAIACDNSEGENPAIGATFWVILPGRENEQVYLPEGSVFSWTLARSTFSGEEGYEPTIVSDYTKEHRVRWGKAQSGSTDHEVIVRECDDALGTNPAEPDLTVLLPHRAGYDHDVATDDVIAFIEAADGTLVCVSDYALDEPIIRFQLAGSLAPDGNASAAIVEWDGDSYEATASFVTVYDANSPGRWRGISGYRGIAVRKKDSGRYEIIWMEEIAEMIVATLATGFSAGISANAAVNANWNGNEPPETVDIHDVEGMYSDLDTGRVVLCKYDWKNGWYHPIDVRETFTDTGFSAIEFTAVGDMTAGVMSVNVDTSWGPTAPGADPINVEDRAGLFTQAKGPDVGTGRTGAKGIAVWDEDAEKWIVIECQTLAGWVHGQMLGDMSGSPVKGSFQVAVYGGSQQDVQHPGTTIDVYGANGLTTDLLTDDYTYALLNSEDGRYYAITPRDVVSRWAVTQGQPDAGPPVTVPVKFCDNAEGDNPTGANVNVILPGRTAAANYIPTGSVISIDKTENDTWTILSDYTAATYYENGISVSTKPILDFYDTASVLWSLTVVGDTVRAEANATLAPTPRDAGMVYFRLTTAFSAGSASATRQNYWGSEDDTVDPGGTLTVTDDHGLFPLGLPLAYGVASHDLIGNEYRVIMCQQMTTRIRGTIPTSLDPCGLTTGTASFTVNVTDIDALDFSPFNLKPTGDGEGDLTIYNDDGWSAASGATFYAEWDHDASKWVMYQLHDGRCEDPEGC